MLRTLTLGLVCTSLLALGLGTVSGCKTATKTAAALTGQNAGAQSSSKKKDCDACEKMCKVAGDSEKNSGGVKDCIDDCHKDCK